MLAERGERLDEAVKLIQRALKIDPEESVVSRQARLGLLQPGQTRSRRRAAGGSRREAARQLRHPGPSGRSAFRQNRRADAIAAWQRALAGDGEASIEPRSRRSSATHNARVKTSDRRVAVAAPGQRLRPCSPGCAAEAPDACHPDAEPRFRIRRAYAQATEGCDASSTFSAVDGRCRARPASETARPDRRRVSPRPDRRGSKGSPRSASRFSCSPPRGRRRRSS